MRWALFLLFLVPSGCGFALRHVGELEDRRAGLDVEPYARVAEPQVRRRALLALARVQDPRTADTVAAALGDRVPEVRAEAAFAAGMLGLSWQPLPEDARGLLANAVLEAEAKEKDPTVRVAIIQALGRLPTTGALDRLKALEASGDARAALALGLATKRGARPPDGSIEAAAALLEQESVKHYGAAYLLAMSKVPAARPGLRRCVEDDDAEVRALCAKGLGDAGDAQDASALQRMLKDPDVRVAVEAVRALVKLKLDLGPLDARSPVLLAAAQAGVSVPADDAKLQCRMAMARDKKAAALSESLACKEQLALALHEIAAAPVSDPLTLAVYLDDKSPAVKLGALDAIGEAKALALAPKIRPLLASDDAILAAAAAGALAKMNDRESIFPLRKLAARVLGKNEDVAPAVADALALLDAKEAVPELQAWLASSNATVRHNAATALTKLTGQKVVAPEVPLLRPGLWPSMGSKVVFTTERGEVEIELWLDETPRTAGNLWSLAKKGYFDGLTFHRIVPDFVAQAGDPRGDGEGGPGYMIRCEVGHRPYVRGTVGMALSGKDTGGSQFFITHTATPHLDGKYTAFGQVTRGMEVVDALLEGDKIVKAVALP